MNVTNAILDFFKSNPLLSFSLRSRITQESQRENAVVPMSVLSMGLVDANGNTNGLEFSTRTSSYTISASDSGKLSRMSSDEVMEFNIPLNSGVPIPIGFQHLIRQVGEGQVEILPADGVTVNTPETLLTRVKGSVIALHKVGENEWDASGDFEPDI